MTRSERSDLEFRVLRLLCQSVLSRGSRESLLRGIDPAIFLEPSHRIVYEELCALSQLPSDRLRELLPARVTNRGFPDFDFDALLEAAPSRGKELEDLLAALRTLREWDQEKMGRPLKISLRSVPSLRWICLSEAFAFSIFVGLYIWRLQTSHASSWILFPGWLILSFALHRDTPKTMGWRADNLWPATRRAAMVIGAFIVGVCVAGIFLGALHRLPEHLVYPRRFGSYLAFCLLQQVALQSFLMNRLLAAIQNERIAALLAGSIFAALHWPNPVLVPLTFIGATAMCWLFARERNILPLALGQAILGALVWWAIPLAWHHAMRVGPGFYTYLH